MRRHRITRGLTPALGLAALAVSATAQTGGQRTDAYTASRDHAAIQYSTRAADTTVTRLNRDLDAGRLRLSFDDDRGYLPALLTALDLPIDSQLLVFSSTSAQASLITPAAPRAIFFNDTTAIGWVRGAQTLEVAAHDSRQGTIFYTLDQRPSDRPRLERRDDCLQCHLTWDTLGVPGWTMISTFPMSDDKNAYASGVTVDHRTDLNMRWGGWYVTGTAVPRRHYGNLPVVRPVHELELPAPLPPALPSVAGTIDTRPYLSPHSDVVASMVLAHQTGMINLLTRLGWEARVAEFDKTTAQRPITSRLDQAVHQVVDYLLFVDEARWSQKIQGSSGFAERFAAAGPRDSRGRSLRQLDLERRLLRYPCSYMVYSAAFDALPPPILDAVYRRMWEVLSGTATAKPYDQLSRAERTAIVEILRETKPGLPAYFQTPTR